VEVFIGLVESHGTCVSSDPQGAAHTAGNPAETTVSLFKTSGAQYLTMSQYVSTRYQGTSTHAWYQQFYNVIYGPGSQNLYSKTTARAVRPVRRLLLSNPYPFTNASVGVSTPSVVDMIVDTRFVSADSPVVLELSSVTSIYSMTATGMSSVGIASSTRVATNITTGTSTIKLTTSNIVSRIYAPTASFNQNWSVANGLDGGFNYPVGSSVDAVEIPTGVGATGSLKFPTAVQAGYFDVTITKTLEKAGTITFYQKVASKQWSDYLNFYIDNVYITSTHGAVAWALKNLCSE